MKACPLEGGSAGGRESRTAGEKSRIAGDLYFAQSV